MSGTLLNKIKGLNPEAACVLEQLDYRTDSELKSLTREDLRDLFPGSECFKMRKDIFEIISRKRPSDVLTSHDSARDPVTGNELADILHILKSMKTKMDQVLARIDHLEELIKKQPDQEYDKGPLPGPSTLLCNGQPQETGAHPGATGGHPQGPPKTGAHPGATGGHPQGTPSTGSFVTAGGLRNRLPNLSWPSAQPPWQVKYQMVVSGKTFGSHQHLMDKVTSQFKDQVQVIESTEDARITILFCPISSRVGSDVEAAMADVKDNKPVILVLMHHTREAKIMTSMRTWKNFDQVVMHVNVFYHETVPGLLQCGENKCAFSEIGNKLLEYKEVISGNAMGVGSQSIQSSRTHHGNNRGSDTNSSGGIFGFWPWSDK